MFNSSRRYTIAKRNLKLFRSKSTTKLDFTFGIPVLQGACECGKVGYTARDTSRGNFYSHSTASSHSTAPRAASGDPYLIASAFKANQVVWRGEQIVNSKIQRSYMPPNSENAHYFCPCEKKQV